MNQFSHKHWLSHNGHFKFLRKFAEIFESKGLSPAGVTAHAAINKKIETGCFFLFDWHAVRLPFNLKYRVLTLCSFWGVGKLMSLQRFHRRCCWHQRYIIASFVVTGDCRLMVSMKIQDHAYSIQINYRRCLKTKLRISSRIFVIIRNGSHGILRGPGVNTGGK